MVCLKSLYRAQEHEHFSSSAVTEPPHHESSSLIYPSPIFQSPSLNIFVAIYPIHSSAKYQPGYLRSYLPPIHSSAKCQPE
jgi:hypothetical protein